LRQARGAGLVPGDVDARLGAIQRCSREVGDRKALRLKRGLDAVERVIGRRYRRASVAGARRVVVAAGRK
jgi:hypothetical protein